MSDFTLIVPEKVVSAARRLAEENHQQIEDVLLQRLDTLATLPTDIANELDALRYLSEDALWTIAREQMPMEVSERAAELMEKAGLSAEEQLEADQLVVRSDRLMLRKATAASILADRGYEMSQGDFGVPA